MQITKYYKENLKLLPKLTKRQRDDLYAIEQEAMAKFKGYMHELESALGMLRIGHYYGWRVLYIIHNKRTIRKYEDILGIKVREYFDETGPFSIRSHGFKMYEEIGRFWKIVSGEEKVPKRKEVE